MKVASTFWETDWLGSRPIFYNEKTSQVSDNINEVIDLTDVAIDPEGFNNYLDFGYSVLEQTPIKNVKFLRHSSRLHKDEKGKLSVEYLDDPVEKWLDYRLSEGDVFDLIRNRVQKWERSVTGEIVIPTSGGYDSRLLNWCIEDKSRIRSFTYGASDDQAESYEVVYARKISEILGTRWEHILLGDFLQYLGDWDALFGISTHAHGMYHFEFYKKILEKVDGCNPFLSGIIGDAWAGSVDLPVFKSSADVKRLGYTHGLNADSTHSRFTHAESFVSAYWYKQKERMEDPRMRVVEAMRFKIILLCYLRRVPEALGFRWWTPFLDIDICMAMLNLPANRRRDRIWQKEFFKKVGLDVESMGLRSTRQNSINQQALCRIPLNPLDYDLLDMLVEPSYVESINRELSKTLSRRWFRHLAAWLRQRRGGWRLSQYCDNKDKRHIDAYFAYMTLLPIQNLLQRCTRS